MEGVEDIPETVLAEGVDFNWETFPEYINYLNSLSRTLDFGVLVPHIPVRFFAMGVRGSDFNSQPTNNEIYNCSIFLHNEIKNLDKIKIIVTLGKVAFDNLIKFYKKSHLINKKFIFKHGKKIYLPDGRILFACYHPSPRNVNTGLLNKNKMKKLFNKVKLSL